MCAVGENLVLGNVEVEGECYVLLLLPSGPDKYEAIRMTDHQCVGTVVSSGWMWRLRSDCPELMQAIIEEAILAGLMQAPPSD
jgi:hypothetical protein